MIIAFKILLGLLISLNNNSQVNDYLKNQLKDYSKFEYQITSPKNINNSDYIIDSSREFKLEKNYGYMPVNFISESGSTKQGLITLKMKLFKKVLVTSRKIFRKEILNNSDFFLEEKEVSSLRVEPIYNTNSISKYRARTNISSETILGENMVEEIPDIKSGDRVEAIFKKGVVNINFDAIARNEGVVGDFIKIKNAENVIFRAKILDNKTVKVIE